MAEIINLKQARKTRTRRARESEADANRRRFGRTRVQKLADKDAEERADRLHGGQRLEKTDTKPDKD